MTLISDARSAYNSTSIGTATPQQLVVMVFERLVLDIERGGRALQAKKFDEANTQLTHAQTLITALSTSLDPEGWVGGHELLALYDYLNRRLIQANVRHDLRAAAEVLTHCRALRDTWKQAAEIVAQSSAE